MERTMKTKHLMVASLLILSFGCKKKYQEGYNAGYDVGHEEGYAETYDSGYADGNSEGLSTGFDSGFADGFESGHATGFGNARVDFASAEYEQGYGEAEIIGYDEGYTFGNEQGTTLGTAEGYADGYQLSYDAAYGFHYRESYDVGYDEGFENEYDNGYYYGSIDGYDDGYDNGYDDGYDDQYDENWEDGYDDGYDDGYGDGYSSGYGSSTSSKNPYVKLISMVNADLVDYSKVRAFDADAASASIGASSGSGTVDMGKLAALKENHYLIQISNQLQGKFGLSTKTAKQVSLVVHQYNKLAGSRSLTEADAKSFSKNLIGFDITTVEEAFKQSLKGDSSKLNGMLNKASSNLGTTPENFNQMISTIFF
jgi:hypothetical protein